MAGAIKCDGCGQYEDGDLIDQGQGFLVGSPADPEGTPIITLATRFGTYQVHEKKACLTKVWSKIEGFAKERQAGRDAAETEQAEAIAEAAAEAQRAAKPSGQRRRRG